VSHDVAADPAMEAAVGFGGAVDPAGGERESAGESAGLVVCRGEGTAVGARGIHHTRAAAVGVAAVAAVAAVA